MRINGNNITTEIVQISKEVIRKGPQFERRTEQIKTDIPVEASEFLENSDGSEEFDPSSFSTFFIFAVSNFQ